MINRLLPAFVLLISTMLILTGCFGNSKKTDNRSAKDVKVNAAGVLPIVDEKVTLNVLIHGQANVEDFATNEFTKWYEEQTNVHLNFEVVGPKGAQEQLNLIMSSGDYPDVIIGFGISATKQMVYGKQGVFIPLNDLIEKYGHGTKEMFKELPRAEEIITAPDGNIYGLPFIGHNPHTFYPHKMWIYEPWLEKLNLDMPTTTEEFYEVLKAFKTQDPNGNGKADEIPFAAATTGWNSQIDNFLMNSFVYTNKATNSYMMLENGKIDVSFTQPGWKEGLKFMNRLYEEGLLAPESFTQDMEQLRRLGENPDVPILGAAPGGTMEFTQINGSSGRWKEYKPMAPLKGPTGLQVAPTSLRIDSNAAFVITKDCPYPEVAFRWADFMYTKEATIRNDNGMFEEHWVWAEEGDIGLNGKPATWKRIYQPSSSGTVQNHEWEHTGPIYNSREIWEGLAIEEGGLEDILYKATVEHYEPYGKNDDKFVPPLFFDEVQAAELATIEQTIRDHVSEMQARFITGDADIEKDWDKYLKTLEGMNLNRFIEIYQEAYDAKYK
ncbi:ABC transporter substrate-binding protein [Lederbergia graminis]|uniref:ABC transporter substrate-binding protein n=1 Tax=Lederbergia graminis TaxID=735518 RepID=A0ABW0LJA8_9BACI